MTWGCSDLFPTGKVLHFWTYDTDKNGFVIESTCGLKAEVPDTVSRPFWYPARTGKCKRCIKGLERIKRILSKDRPL